MPIGKDFAGNDQFTQYTHKRNKPPDNKQVLCITHIASIASRADNHIKVEKAERSDRTVTEISAIDGSARVDEIARMLAGDRTGSASRNHAEDLLRRSARTQG